MLSSTCILLKCSLWFLKVLLSQVCCQAGSEHRQCELGAVSFHLGLSIGEEKAFVDCLILPILGKKEKKKGRKGVGFGIYLGSMGSRICQALGWTTWNFLSGVGKIFHIIFGAIGWFLRQFFSQETGEKRQLQNSTVAVILESNF